VVSIYDVARGAGVSAATVSNFLNRPDKVAAGTSSRIRAAIEDLGYVPRLSARQLRWGRSGVVGMCVANAANPHFADIVAAAEETLESAGLSVVVGSSAKLADKQARLLGLFEQMRVDGVLVAAPDGQMDQVRAIEGRGTPVVLLDHHDQGDGLDVVEIDHAAGGRAAARHLLASGRRRLLAATGPPGVQQSALRLAGFQEVVGAAPGASVDLVRSPDLGLGFGEEVGRRIAAMPPGVRPDGVFAANDMHALGIEHGLLSGGARVPQDVALVGYDDIPFAAYAPVPLTSVRQPRAAIGRAAAERLVARLGQGPVDAAPVSHTPELVVRASAPA
jgi:LacI family transcriptional regulator